MHIGFLGLPRPFGVGPLTKRQMRRLPLAFVAYTESDVSESDREALETPFKRSFSKAQRGHFMAIEPLPERDGVAVLAKFGVDSQEVIERAVAAVDNPQTDPVPDAIVERVVTPRRREQIEDLLERKLTQQGYEVQQMEVLFA